MLFTTPEFFFFLVITFCIYYLPVLRRFQPVILIGASLLFYYSGADLLIFLLIASVVVNAAISFLIAKQQSGNTRKLMWLGVVFNLATLCAFKYCALIVTTVMSVVPEFGDRHSQVLHAVALIPLPLGISFFCFEGISLTIDGCKRLFKGETTFAGFLKETALFICFFPHLIAGPILRASEFLPQISSKSFSRIEWYLACKWMIIGYFLKVFVANNLQDFTWRLSYPQFLHENSFTNIFYLGAYSVQIFADFAGYSYIALGLAYLFGYHIPNNFNAPYISQSLGDFWSRWHISLSTWLRDYLFIPLGGSRHSKRRACFNVFLVMTVGGLWHGASWNYAGWGILHGAGLVAEHLFSRGRERSQNLLTASIRICGVFTFVSGAWILFILKSPEHIAEFVRHLASSEGHLISAKSAAIAIVYIAPVALIHYWTWMKELKPVPPYMLPARPLIKGLALGIMLFCTIVNPGPEHEFIYFQF